MVELRDKESAQDPMRRVASSRYGLTASDAVWIATASLHFERKSDGPFSSNEIFRKVRQLNLTDCADNTVQAHIAKHCVANTNPDPNRVRMLFAPSRGFRRLFRAGDSYDHGREGSPVHPDWSSLPAVFGPLRKWYEQEWASTISLNQEDPLLALIGAGAELWRDEPADQYVANLRANWGGQA